jgi:lysozyme family protein
MDYPKIFLDCIEVVLRNEGGISDNPNDPGGYTNMGLTQRNYPMEDLKNLTKDKAIAIYYRDYWLPMDVDLLNNPELILQVFDMGVNSGIRMGIKLLQRMVGTIDDGFIGQITVKAVNDFSGDVVDEYKKRRKLFYVTLAQNKPSLRVFLKGWLSRVDWTHF